MMSRYKMQCVVGGGGVQCIAVAVVDWWTDPTRVLLFCHCRSLSSSLSSSVVVDVCLLIANFFPPNRRADFFPPNRRWKFFPPFRISAIGIVSRY